MKTTTILIFCFFMSFGLYSQDKPAWKTAERTIISVGILQGGGGFFGADIEYLIFPHVGIQAGVGIKSFGGGIVFHLKPQPNSSGFVFEYLHEGFESDIYHGAIAGSFLFRSKSIFQFKIGGAVRMRDSYKVNFFYGKRHKKLPNPFVYYTIGIYF